MLLISFVVVCIFTSILSLFFGIFVYLKGRAKRVNQIWGLMSLSVTFWSLGLGLMANAPNETLALFYLRGIHYFGAVFIPAFFLHFVLVLLGLDRIRKKLIIVGYVFALGLQITNFSGLLAYVIPLAPFKYYTRPGFFYLTFTIFFAICVLYALYLLFVELKRSSGARRNQIKYQLLATVIGFGGGATAFFPVFDIPIFPYGMYFMFLYILMMSYAIIKHRLMDIKLARQYLAMNIFYGLVTSAIFIGLAFFLRQWFWGISIVIFLGIIFSPYLHRRMTKFLEPAFLGETYQRWEGIRKFWERERIVFTSGQLAETLKEISEVMDLESFSFFVFEPERKVFVPRAYHGLDGVFDPEQAEVLNTLYPDSALVMYLQKEKKMVIREELIVQRDELKQVVAQMDEMKAQISLPLFVAGRLTGILNLGPKREKEVFHEKDLGLIREMSQTAQRHLSHIAFFENSLLFSGSVAHDIRKPFRQGIIYGCLDALQKGPLNPTQEEALANLKGRLVRLDNMSEDMVGAFKNLELFLKSGFKPQKIDYSHLIDKESRAFQALAKEKGPGLETVFFKKDFFVFADPLSVQRILNELLSNALKYTDKGKITIKVSQENPEEVLTEISDTGCGIAEEDQREIWELFKRGKNGQKKEGAGIGLAMVRQLVEANGGRIWLDSERGKGTRFFFTLPAWEDKKVR